MKSAVILALASSTLAVPFGNVINAVFGTSLEAHHRPRPDNMPNFPPIGHGSGTAFAFPTATGAFPTASGGFHAHPTGHIPRPNRGPHHKSKTLVIDYQLAPTAAPKVKLGQREAGNATSLPSFTLLDPSDVPGGVPGSTSTGLLPVSTPSVPIPTPSDEPSFPLPTPSPGSPFPTGSFPFPSGGFPGTGIPSLPTTLATRTRGPRPTRAPATPSSPAGDDGDDESKNEPSWWEIIEGLFGGKRGSPN